eukprot:jgi/Botrbrau1/7105/Bobra.0165s0125.2
MTPEDAVIAAQAGADFIGMIMWQKAKRAVKPERAREIVEAASQHGAKPVGVFVDEDAPTIISLCLEAGLSIAQLHGEGARRSMSELPSHLQTIYVLQSNMEGRLQTPPPSSSLDGTGRRPSREADWLLIDGQTPGSGEAFDWRGLQLPPDLHNRGWFLAGGLGPENVAEAVRLVRPTGVDVSSGVTYPDGLRKDPDKVVAFVQAVRGAAGVSTG